MTKMNRFPRKVSRCGSVNREEVGALLSMVLLASLAFHGLNIEGLAADPLQLVVDDDGPADFSRIQDAIDEAQLGDTIYVQTGIYYENLLVSKSVSIFGENKSTTIIDGSNAGTVVLIMSNETVVKGFTIRNGENGVSVSESSNCLVEDNIVIDNTERGILISRSENCVVRNNNVYGSRAGYGVNVNASNHVLVENNGATSNFWDGIGLLNSANCILRGNTISHNEVFGIWIDSSINNMIYQNNLFNNTFQASCNTQSNFWDNGTWGNYWADYEGVDEMNGLYQNASGSDGLGDIPYVVDKETKQQDNYPLWLPNVNAMYLSLDIDPPIAVITYDQGPHSENETVSFTALGSYDSAGNHTILGYYWSFGDNTTAHGFSVNHSYTYPGNYTVSLSLTDIAGNQDYTAIKVHIQSKIQTDDSSPVLIIVLGAVVSVLVIVLVLWTKNKRNHL
jgi:parallel beta-helix repeat protein